ncbi:hypothetical protein KGQ27_02020 [Patescibacteria group bacterium]|nr:hypothetical protein [Patescibacteria group bacterium]MDE1946305.1 hypothetical protein [Patescibacteria group bacterium]MDE2010757.1 hypothetical protein [Patescibacteria group bacterium]MDE2232641.1 hypothetical protein [Patescibacteria group bacterium]
MTKAIANTVYLTNEYRALIARILTGGCLLAVLVYGLNIYAAISDAVALEKVENETAIVENKVQALDTNYIALSGKITPDMAKSYGLTQTATAEYINRNGALSVAR